MNVAVEMMPDWKRWEGESVAGEFPLEKFLGAGEKSAVFRTQLHSGNGAIKLVLAEDVTAGQLLDQWNRARDLDHPHLIKIAKSGTWANAGLSLAYLVTEYAEEDLATVLQERALTPDETFEMLQPVAEALAFLHGHGFVHGDLKPANILAVNETLKVSSDAVSKGNPSGDLRAVAATVVQALTRKIVTFMNGSETNLVSGLPQPFQEIVRNCSGQNGQTQWSAAELAEWLRSRQQSTVIAAVAPIASDTRPKTRKSKLTTYAIASGLIAVAVGTVGSMLRSRTVDPVPPVAEQAAKTTEQAPNPNPTKPAARELPVPEQSPKNTAPSPRAPRARHAADASDQVTLQVLPEITAKARRTVHGKVEILVRVVADQSGDVTDATLQSTGSQYFGKLALEAARKWHFAPAPGNGGGAQDWLLRFEITRTETKVYPEKPAGR